MKKILFTLTSLLIVASSTYTPVYAESATTSETENTQLLQKMDAVQKSIKKGNITLPNGMAELKLNENMRYIPPQSAETMLVDFWGNPAGSGSNTQGMLLPRGVDVTSPESWGVVITYEEDGHIADDEATKINYDDLLKEIQGSIKEATQQENAPQVELVGWADKPYYDQSSHKMYWAKEIKFNNEPENTLNYNVRILGRKGVLVLNAVSEMKNIEKIKTSMRDVIGFTDFTSGNKYSDFNPTSDKVAEYGLTALILGGVGIASKTGLFAKLLVLLLAFKKILIFGVLAIGGGVYKLFGKLRGSQA